MMPEALYVVMAQDRVIGWHVLKQTFEVDSIDEQALAVFDSKERAQGFREDYQEQLDIFVDLELHPLATKIKKIEIGDEE